MQNLAGENVWWHEFVGVQVMMAKLKVKIKKKKLGMFDKMIKCSFKDINRCGM